MTNKSGIQKCSVIYQIFNPLGTIITIAGGIVTLATGGAAAPLLLAGLLWSGVNFINIFMHSFYAHRSLKRNKTVKPSVSFCAFGIELATFSYLICTRPRERERCPGLDDFFIWAGIFLIFPLFEY